MRPSRSDSGFVRRVIAGHQSASSSQSVRTTQVSAHSCQPLLATGSNLEVAGIVQIVPTVSIETRSTSEILRLSVPSPEPRALVFRPKRPLALVFVPADIRSRPENTRALLTDIARQDERANVHKNAVIKIRIPPDG